MGILHKYAPDESNKKDFKFYENRSNSFAAEVKNLLRINVPGIEPAIADYLAIRIDTVRLQYESALLNRHCKMVGNDRR